MWTYKTNMSIHIPHMNSLQWPMWLGTLVYINSTSLTYACEQICLPHYTYISHCTYRPHISAHNYQNSINCNIYLTYYCKIYASNKYASQMPHICHMPNYSIWIYWQSMSMLHMNPLASIIWPGVLYTNDNDVSADNYDDNTAQYISWVDWPNQPESIITLLNNLYTCLILSILKVGMWMEWFNHLRLSKGHKLPVFLGTTSTLSKNLHH